MSSYDYIVEVEKFNPYHGRDGRFTSAGGASSMTIHTRSKLSQGAADKAIARAKEKASTKNSGQVLRNPTGNYEVDRKREWEGADYAVLFRDNERFGKLMGKLDLNDDSTRTHDGGSWRDGAYGNMKIETQRWGSSSIYMMDEKGAKDAEAAALKRINRVGSMENGKADWNQNYTILEDELSKRALRIIDKEYLDAQDKARESRMSKSLRNIETIIEAKVRKANEHHDSATGRFTFAPRQHKKQESF